MPRKIHFNLIGCGKIGFAVLKYIDEKSSYITETTGYELIPHKVYDKYRGRLRSLKDFRSISPQMAHSAREVIDDPLSTIMVEATGTDKPARDCILRALGKNESVVTPNKHVMAKYTRKLFEEANRCGQEIGFESSVMGGVPVINILRGNIDKINGYLGIFNGTTNLILTQMGEKRFDEALACAQKIGAAEPDSSFDISGMDTAHKNIILATLSYGADIDYDIATGPEFVQGIGDITDFDIKIAGEFGYKIKMLGKTRLHDDGRLEIGTFPFLVRSDHMLAEVKDTFNAIYIDFEDKGPHMYYGKGAAPGPTAPAVVEDMIDIAKRRGKTPNIPFIGNKIDLTDPSEKNYPFYIRFNAVDNAQAAVGPMRVLGENDVSMAGITQKKELAQGGFAPVCVLTHEANTGKVMRAIKYIDGVFNGKTTKGKTLAIRVEND